MKRIFLLTLILGLFGFTAQAQKVNEKVQISHNGSWYDGKILKVDGDKVEVEYGMVPEPAEVVEVGENKYKIQYEKKAFGTKWVTEKQMKKL